MTSDIFVLPGRIRIHFTNLKGNKRLASEMSGNLKDVAGLEKVSVSHHTGNILVVFNQKLISTDGVKHLLYAAGANSSSPVCDERLIYTDTQVVGEMAEQYDNGSISITPVLLAFSLISFAIFHDPSVFLSLILILYPKTALNGTYAMIASAIGMAESKGITVNNPSGLRQLDKADIILFDKDGTLTTGEFMVSGCSAVGRNNDRTIISLAASCMAGSRNPIPRSLLKEAEVRSIELMQSSAAFHYGRMGSICMINGKRVIAGDRRLLVENGIQIKSALTVHRKIVQMGGYPLYVSDDDRIIGLIDIRDILREDCIDVIEKIRETGVWHIELVSEDPDEAVEATAAKLGIDICRGGMEPSDMNEIVRRYRKEDHVVVFIADSRKAYPEKDAADVDIALAATVDGIGPEVKAEETNAGRNADLVISDSNLGAIPYAFNLSAYMSEIAYQNRILSLGLDTIGLILVLSNAVMPLQALIYKQLGIFLVILNSIRSVKRVGETYTGL